MENLKDSELYHRHAKNFGKDLSREEREALVKPHLPPVRDPVPPSKSSSRPHGTIVARPRRRKPIRSFLKLKLHVLAYFVVHLIFGIYIRLRQTYHAVVDRILALLYYHHRTPELIQRDVKNLSRLPKHLSVILTLRGEEDGGLEAFMDDVAELSAWCASAGIPLLSIYEKSGILKPNMRVLHSIVSQRLSSYYGSSPQTPHPRLHAPNYSPYPASPPDSPSTFLPTTMGITSSTTPQRTIDILLLSCSDGRDTIVDLTRTLAEMSQSHKLRPQEITQDLIDAELSATTSISPSSPTTYASSRPTTTHSQKPMDILTDMAQVSSSEPDLLIIFGPYIRLDGYPPWQIRLTEILCVGDSGGGFTGRSRARVEYQGFLKGLWKFAGAELKFGK